MSIFRIKFPGLTIGMQTGEVPCSHFQIRNWFHDHCLLGNTNIENIEILLPGMALVDSTIILRCRCRYLFEFLVWSDSIFC